MTEKQTKVLRQVSNQLAERIDCDVCIAREFCESDSGKDLCCKDTIATFLKGALYE